MQDVDVAIVGCGPTGATLGNLLARRGHRIALLDRATEIYPKPRAITADHEALRVFQECGLAEEISAGAIAHPGTDYLGVRGQVIKRFYPLDSLPPLAWEPTFMFAQPELEAVLRRGLQHHSNARMMLGRELLAYEQDDTGVSLRLDGGELLRARYLLACDGAEAWCESRRAWAWRISPLTRTGSSSTRICAATPRCPSAVCSIAVHRARGLISWARACCGAGDQDAAGRASARLRDRSRLAPRAARVRR